MSFLEYQDEMYLNAVNDADCLVIASRGLGIEQLMVRLCRTYSDDTNLVIVIGTTPEDELYFTNELIDEKNIPYGKLPQRITAESSNTKKRHEIYMKGGVLFVTERILVVDLLSDRVPIDLVTGIMVYRAHKIFNDCLMSFILRLYRMKNKKGFVKAFSQNPQSFFGDFGKLDKIMRALFVTSLQLWPRFHASVQTSLGPPKTQPNVIEISLPMTQTMKNIQLDIMDLIDMCLKELAKTNTAFLYDSDQLNVENAINRSFDGFIKSRFDEIWHQLGTRAKRLINDIQWLRNLLRLLTQSDVVAFYNQTRAAQNSVRLGHEVSDWIFWKPADRLFRLSKERLYPNNAGIEDFDAETNLKWKAFQDLIDEIDTETKEIEDTVHVFIIVANDSAVRLLQAILSRGAPNVLRERIERFNAIMKANTGSADAVELHGLQEESTDAADQQQRQNQNLEPPVKRRYRQNNPAAEVRQPESNFTLTQIVRKMNDKEGRVITIDDDTEDNNLGDEASDTIREIPEELLESRKVHALKLHYFISARDERVFLETQLRDYKPLHVIMYDFDMHAIRQLEVYQALHCHPKQCKIYTIQFENSTDVQQYLTSLRREKEAFESLIKEKASLVIPRGRDGRTDGHPDLVRGEIRANETTDSANTRRAGGQQLDRNDILQQKILVDMREFRCELPSIIHKRGIEIEPVQLEIGDYILSSDTCVERKSVSDLIQSLQSGRLYNQAAMMIRHFKRSILLIEFDETKSFHFKGRYWGGVGGYSGPRRDGTQDLVDKLILLTIHHPQLRLIWSPSTHFSAEIFEYLKVDRDQPNPERIASITSEELPPETFEDRYDIQAREFLLKLPGVNSRNVYALMNAVPTLADLVSLSVEELDELLHNSRSAELLHRTLHSSLRDIASEAIRVEQANKKSRLFGCTKRRKGII